MDNAIPTNQIPAQSSPSPITPTQLKPKSSKLLILIIFHLIAVMIFGYLIYQNIQLKKQTPQIQSSPTSTPDLTANWKRFSDTQIGVEFRYPDDWYAKRMTGWNNIFLNNRDFVIPEATEFMTPIQISLNEVMDTTTNVKTYSEKTIEDTVKRFKRDVYGDDVIETDNLTIDGHKAAQLSGTSAPGMLGGMYFKVTFIQMNDRVLIVWLNNNKNYETLYSQILSTIKFIQ